MDKKRKNRRIGLLSFFFVFLCLLISFGAQNAQAAQKQKKGLVKEGRAYRYYKRDGTILKNHWKTISGKRYYFKKNGSAATGSYRIKGRYYVFDQKGRLCASGKKRLVTVGKRKYFVDEKGGEFLDGMWPGENCTMPIRLGSVQ